MRRKCKQERGDQGSRAEAWGEFVGETAKNKRKREPQKPSRGREEGQKSGCYGTQEAERGLQDEPHGDTSQGPTER